MHACSVNLLQISNLGYNPVVDLGGYSPPTSISGHSYKMGSHACVVINTLILANSIIFVHFNP